MMLAVVVPAVHTAPSSFPVTPLSEPIFVDTPQAHGVQSARATYAAWSEPGMRTAEPSNATTSPSQVSRITAAGAFQEVSMNRARRELSTKTSKERHGVVVVDIGGIHTWAAPLRLDVVMRSAEPLCSIPSTQPIRADEVGEETSGNGHQASYTCVFTPFGR